MRRQLTQLFEPQLVDKRIRLIFDDAEVWRQVPSLRGITDKNARGPGGRIMSTASDSDFSNISSFRSLLMAKKSPQQWRMKKTEEHLDELLQYKPEAFDESVRDLFETGGIKEIIDIIEANRIDRLTARLLAEHKMYTEEERTEWGINTCLISDWEMTQIVQSINDSNTVKLAALLLGKAATPVHLLLDEFIGSDLHKVIRELRSQMELDSGNAGAINIARFFGEDYHVFMPPSWSEEEYISPTRFMMYLQKSIRGAGIYEFEGDKLFDPDEEEEDYTRFRKEYSAAQVIGAYRLESYVNSCFNMNQYVHSVVTCDISDHQWTIEVLELLINSSEPEHSPQQQMENDQKNQEKPTGGDGEYDSDDDEYDGEGDGSPSSYNPGDMDSEFAFEQASKEDQKRMVENQLLQQSEELNDLLREEYGHHSMSDSSEKWMKMKIIRYEMDRYLPSRMISPAAMHSDRGHVPRAMHRYTSDKNIFIQKRRAVGGSVLIDVSGSMNVSNDDIHEIIQTIPAGIVALYSAHTGSEKFGFLRIVAEEGRCVERHLPLKMGPMTSYDWSSSQFYGHNNGVDLPALRWLAEQDPLRLWISDGYVTGQRGYCTTELIHESLDYCRAKRIIRVENKTEAITTFVKANA